MDGIFEENNLEIRGIEDGGDIYDHKVATEQGVEGCMLDSDFGLKKIKNSVVELDFMFSDLETASDDD